MAELARDQVFAALTRPQTIGGVSYSFFVLNLIVTAEVFLLTKSFWAILVAAVLHLIGYVAGLNEPRFFDLWLTRARTCPRVPNYARWRANSYRP
jgi:type IV secretion system protein VirB3